MDLVWLRKCGCFLFLSLLVSFFLCGTDGALAPEKRSTKNAYATMLYMGTPRDYEFYVAARVMFRSLARLKVDADLVVIASQDVPKRWIEKLHKDGVKVVSVVNIDNPYKNQPSFDRRFALTLNKLYAWSLVEYARVVMLDADNLFLQKTDELFQCGQFCAAFINPCIFHTGLFVLQPSEKVFHDMLHELASGRENEDGADQGFLVSYFHDLLNRPMFYPTINGSKLNGYFRLPLGYQMDASYYYLKLRWNVPCGPNSVITFPSAPWLKPWYWWAWPVLPLGFSWHEQRRLTIGYGEEMPLIVAESLFYLITIAVAIFAMRGSHLQTSSSKLCHLRPEQSFSFYSVVLKMLVLSCMAVSYLVPFFLVPRTIHPLVGWGLYLLGSLSFLVVIINTFQIPALAVLTPWIEIFCVLLVMAFPLYSNGIVRALSVAAYAFFAAPFLWWSIVRLLAFLDTCIERESLFSRSDQPPSELMKLC